MGKRLTVLFAGALAVGLVLVGCGGSDSSTASITKAEFIKKADAACEKGEKQIQDDFAVYAKEHEDAKKPTEEDYAELVAVVLAPNIEEEVEDIRALGAPSGDADQVKAMLDAREEVIEIAEDDPNAVVKNGEEVFAKSSKLAKDYGLQVCSDR